MFSARTRTQTRKVRYLPWPKKISFFKTTFETGAVFLEMGVGANLFAQTLDTRLESEVLTMG